MSNVGKLLAVSILALAGSGCRLPGGDGPIPKPLATSRRLSQQAVALGERNQWDRAESLLSQAVKTCPSDPDARSYYADALANRGKTASAIAQLDEALRLTPDDVRLQVRMGELRLANGQLTAATECAQRAIQLDPRLPSAWALRAGVLRAQGRLQDALAEYQRALAFQPDDRGLRLKIAELYGELGQPDRALAALQALAETYPPGEEPPRVLYWEGLVYKNQGRYEAAVECLEAAHAADSANPDILFHLAEAQRGAGATAQAIATARHALDVAPDHQASLALLRQMGQVTAPRGEGVQWTAGTDDSAGASR